MYSKTIADKEREQHHTLHADTHTISESPDSVSKLPKVPVTGATKIGA